MRSLPYFAFLAVAAISPLPAEEASPTPASWETLATEVHDAFGKEDVAQLSHALDAAAAINLAKALDLAAQHSLDPTVVAGGWRPAPENAESAFKIILNAPHSSYQQHLLLGTVHSWVKRDPHGARTLIDTLPESPERSDLQEIFRQALLRFRPKDALDLALSERGTPGAIKVNDAAHALTKEDRAMAIAALAALPAEDSNGRIQVVSSITKDWAAKDPLAAAEWSKTTLDADSEKEVAYEEVLYTWSHSDPDAASAWALSLDPGTPRDSALRAFVFRTAHQQPAKAFHVGIAMDDPPSQETALFTAIAEWATIDKPAAKAAIETADSLPAELRQRLKTDLDAASR